MLASVANRVLPPPQWWPEVAHFCEGVPLILVGTKTDLRSDQHALDLLAAQGRKPITAVEGKLTADKMGAKYMEVSSRLGQGVQEVFAVALKEAMEGKRTAGNGRKRKRRTCKVL